MMTGWCQSYEIKQIWYILISMDHFDFGFCTLCFSATWLSIIYFFLNIYLKNPPYFCFPITGDVLSSSGYMPASLRKAFSQNTGWACQWQCSTCKGERKHGRSLNTRLWNIANAKDSCRPEGDVVQQKCLFCLPLDCA